MDNVTPIRPPGVLNSTASMRPQNTGHSELVALHTFWAELDLGSRERVLDFASYERARQQGTLTIDPPPPVQGAVAEDKPSKPRRPRSKRRRKGLLLRASEDSEGFTTTDLINGLHGVCVALDDAIVNRLDGNNAQYLAQAAKVLSTMVRDRVE